MLQNNVNVNFNYQTFLISDNVLKQRDNLTLNHEYNLSRKSLYSRILYKFI